MTDVIGLAYRGWSVRYIYPPIPVRDYDWQATHPDYDGAGPDYHDDRVLLAPTREAVCALVDEWTTEHEAEATAGEHAPITDDMVFNAMFVAGGHWLDPDICKRAAIRLNAAIARATGK